MDTNQVTHALDKLFQQERIVFWNDPEKEFVGYVTEQLFSPLEGVKILLGKPSTLLAEVKAVTGEKAED